MNRIKQFFKSLLFGLIIGTATFSISSCSATEKKATSYDFAVVSCVYNAEKNTTDVYWYSRIVNDSIYDMKEESFKFDLYDGDTFLRTTDYFKYKLFVKSGQTNQGQRYFTVNEKVTDAKINTWKADFANLWESYFPWFIATIVITPLLAIAYIIIIIITDSGFDDVIEWIEDNLWSMSMLIIPFAPYVITSFTNSQWSWVPPLIIAGGLIVVILVALFTHLIRYCHEEGLLVGGRGGRVKIKKHYDSKNQPFLEIGDSNKRYYIKDLYKDRETLSHFSRKDLRNYCFDKKWTGAQEIYSKEKLSIFIMDKTLEKKQKEDNDKNQKNNTKNKKYSKTRFDDIAGLKEAKEAFKEKVVMPFLHPELFEKFGKKAGGGILLYGLPGTGKTMFAEAAANEIDALFIPIKCSDIKSKWYGESEKKIKGIFDKARKAEKAIIFFDEFEAIGAKRTDSENGNNDLVPEILAEMQGVGSSSNKSVIIVIAATNKPWAIDSAFMRPGRFDEKIYIPLPDFEARKKLFEIQLSKLPISNDLDFDYLAKITDGFNGADIKEVCEKLKMSAINGSLEKGDQQTIGMDDVKKIEGSIKSSVSFEDIERLKEFEED